MSTSITELALALSCPTRLAILDVLSPNMPFGEVADRVGITRATLTYHATVLEDAGLVVVDQTGTRKYMRLKYRELRIPLGAA
jgi:DNA-binding transcriptional ArsR family regulator